MRLLSVLLTVLISLPFPVHLSAQAQAGQLNLVIVEGEGAINNIRQRTAREPIIQVEDENHRPVAGAAVVFALPSNGASGVFANGSQTLTTITDAQGRAIARGLRPNNVQGQYQIRVTASQGGRTGTATITQTNAIVAGAAAAGAAAGISMKLIAILAVAGAAAAGGAAYAATRGGGSSTPAATPTLITAGGGTVGPPR
jgi:hypothetical protein